MAVAILSSLARHWLPVGALYAVKSTGVLAAVTIGAASAVRDGHPFNRIGPANLMTLARAALVALVVGLIGEPAVPSVAAGATAIAVLVELLDGADGWLARRGGVASAFGARFDMEVDALLIMALAILAWLHGKAGAWVLLSGLLRYGFVAGGWIAPWLSSPLPPSRRRQAICVVQIVCLCAAVSPALAPERSAALAAAALVVLAASFALDVGWLWRAKHQSARPLSELD